jgi:two-component system nitrogen regulation response regulator NtrX
MCPESEISEKSVALLLHPGQHPLPEESGTTRDAPYRIYDFKKAKREFERQYLRNILQQNNGNVSQAADRIGLERSHLYKKLKSLDINN